MRLIDGDLLMKTVFNDLFLVDGEVKGVGIILAETVDKAPTIDAVPVVRCRECKHLNVVNRKELYAHCPKTNTVFLPFELDTREHFCSLGERKEGAENEP